MRVESAKPIRVGPLVRFLEEQGAEVSEARRMRPSLEDVFVRDHGHRSGRHAQRERENRRRAHETVDRLLEHPGQGHADLLPKTTQHQLGADFPPGMDGHVLHPFRQPDWTAFCRCLPGVVAISILFGTTSMLAVTVTFEKKNRSFERLLLAPIPLELLMLAKTGGAIFFGVANAFVPVAMAVFLIDLSQVAWTAFLPAVVLIAVVSTFLGLFIAVAVSEVFEAQTFSNFFRFPMIFLCGLFFPIAKLPVFLKPLSYVLPLTYGVDILRWGFEGKNFLPLGLDFGMLLAFCALLFWMSLHNIRRRWIA